MNGKGREKKLPVRRLSRYLEIYMEGLRKTTNMSIRIAESLADI
jgi:hypothetical protein